VFLPLLETKLMHNLICTGSTEIYSRFYIKLVPILALYQFYSKVTGLLSCAQMHSSRSCEYIFRTRLDPMTTYLSPIHMSAVHFSLFQMHPRKSWSHKAQLLFD
jgi:hypothetical protein